MISLLRLGWPVILMALLMYGFAPGAVLRVIVLAFRRDDPRRRELLGELYHVPRTERPFWVIEQLEVALFEGLGRRLGKAIVHWSPRQSLAGRLLALAQQTADRAEANATLGRARREADEILRQARREAQKILAEAEGQA